MPTQSTAERLLASLHTLLSSAMPLGAKVLRNAILPEKVPAAGVVILRDGDPGPPEVWLSPPGYYYEHRAEIELVVDGTPAARDAAFDALRLAIGMALATDRTLGGLCDYITPEAPETVLLAIDGNEGLKAAVIPVNLTSALYRGTGAATATIGDRRFTVATGLGAFASGWFDFGVVEWTSGANAGRRAEVASHTQASGTATITLMEAPVRPIAPGDAFAITAGCDKRHATCRDRFGNSINFRGFPSIPGDDLVTRYPNETDANSGAPLRPLADG